MKEWESCDLIYIAIMGKIMLYYYEDKRREEDDYQKRRDKEFDRRDTGRS